MLIYGSPVCEEENRYDFQERDAICSKCHKVVDRQIKYDDFDKKFIFSTKDKDKWKFCPYCGEKL